MEQTLNRYIFFQFRAGEFSGCILIKKSLPKHNFHHISRGGIDKVIFMLNKFNP